MDRHCDGDRGNVTRPFLCFLFFCLSAAQEQEIHTAAPGEDITLTCRASSSRSLSGVEWRRADLMPEDILLYRDEQFVTENQHPAFKDRVDLQDRHMTDGDVSMILKDVSTADEGRYECRALTPGRKRERRAAETIKTIDLRVSPAGAPVGVAVGLSVAALALLAAAAGFVIYRKRRSRQSPASSLPPAVEMQLLHHV